MDPGVGGGAEQKLADVRELFQPHEPAFHRSSLMTNVTYMLHRESKTALHQETEYNPKLRRLKLLDTI